MSSRLSAAQPTLGQGYEMYAIAAAVIGGTSLRGGRASIFGAVIGAVTIQTIFNGLTVMGVQDQWQKVVLGVVVLVAVWVDIMPPRRQGGVTEPPSSAGVSASNRQSSKANSKTNREEFMKRIVAGACATLAVMQPHRLQRRHRSHHCSRRRHR